MPDPAQLGRWARTALTSPPRVTARKATAKVTARRQAAQARRRDSETASYALDARDLVVLPLCREPTLAALKPHAETLVALTARYLEHRFDLLGSGWVGVRHGMRCDGLEGFRYDQAPGVLPRPGDVSWVGELVAPPDVAEARRIWAYVDADYVPIDWQLDFKSGWRWSERTWYRDVTYGTEPGVDVKVPWELARGQHLPQLALAAALAREGVAGFVEVERYRREYRNEVLDFIATNPPRFGVNWVTSMDVALRVVSWLVAHDLFRATGEFDAGFESVFARSVLEHGRHIAANLEWSDEVRGNHYLSDLVGLLAAGAALPAGPETNGWLAFAIRELLDELDVQLQSDGTIFEGSTSYHALSTQLATFACAVILGLDDDRLAAVRAADPGSVAVRVSRRPRTLTWSTLEDGRSTPIPMAVLRRLADAGAFIVAVTAPDGRIVQVGDNDSGRLLKLTPDVRAGSAEDVRSHRDTVAMVVGLVANDDLVTFAGVHRVETELIRGIARLDGLKLKPELRYDATTHRAGADGDWNAFDARLAGGPVEDRFEATIALVDGTDPDRLAFPEFGLFVLRTPDSCVTIRCGGLGQGGYGGHDHNDQLSVELWTDGRPIARDPGTYVYTPLPDKRNEYRSRRAHVGPPLSGPEPASLDLGLFRLGDEAESRCAYWGPRGFIGSMTSQGRGLHLQVAWAEQTIKIVYLLDGWPVAPAGIDRGSIGSVIPRIPFSPGYGVIERDEP